MGGGLGIFSDSVVADACPADLLRAAHRLMVVAYGKVAEHGERLSQEDLVDEAVLAQQVQNSAWAIQSHRLAQAAEVSQQGDAGEDEWFPLELGARMGWTDRQAGARLGQACEATGSTPGLLDLAGAGELEARKVSAVASLTAEAPEHVAAEVEATILASAPEATTSSKLAAKARRLLAKLDPVAADENSKNRRRGYVGVFVTPHHEPGLSELTAVLPTLDAAKLMAAIDQLARDLHQVTTTDKTLPECRVDALTDLALNGVGVDTQLTFLIPVTAPEPAVPAVDDGEQAGAIDWSDWDEEFEDPFGEEAFQRHEAVMELVAREEGMTPINSRDLMDEELRALFDEELAELNAQVAAAAAERARTNARDANARDTGAGSDPPGCGHDLDTDENADAITGRNTGTAPSLGISDVLLPKVGIIPAQVVIEMTQLLGVKLSRALTDAATGTVVETADRSYRPGARLARFVQTRDQHCRFPGCTRPAKLSDIDHVIRYPDGETTAGNLQCLCRHHHRAKHEAGWTVAMTPTGVCTWTSPSGHIYITSPAD